MGFGGPGVAASPPTSCSSGGAGAWAGGGCRLCCERPTAAAAEGAAAQEPQWSTLMVHRLIPVPSFRSNATYLEEALGPITDGLMATTPNPDYVESFAVSASQDPGAY